MHLTLNLKEGTNDFESAVANLDCWIWTLQPQQRSKLRDLLRESGGKLKQRVCSLTLVEL